MLQVFLRDTKPRGFVVPSPLMVVHRCQARVAESSAEDFINLLFIIGKLFDQIRQILFLGRFKPRNFYQDRPIDANMMNSSSLSRSPPPPCSPLHSRHSRVASLPQIMHCRGEFSMTSVTSSSCDGRMRSYTLNCFPNRGICEHFGA